MVSLKKWLVGLWLCRIYSRFGLSTKNLPSELANSTFSNCINGRFSSAVTKIVPVLSRHVSSDVLQMNVIHVDGSDVPSEMAFRAAKNWRSMLMTQLGGGGGRRTFATPTAPKMSPGIGDANSTNSRTSVLKAELAPVYIVCGMVCVALTFGTHIAFQQLVRSPTVHVNKKRRESMPEVSDPDRTIDSASKFVNGSFFRKMSHIQENKATLSDPVHPDPFTRPRTAETLKTVGIEPRH